MRSQAERCTLSMLFLEDEILPEAGECRLQKGAASGDTYAIAIHRIKRKFQNNDGEWIVEVVATRYPVTAASRKDESEATT